MSSNSILGTKRKRVYNADSDSEEDAHERLLGYFSTHPQVEDEQDAFDEQYSHIRDRVFEENGQSQTDISQEDVSGTQQNVDMSLPQPEFPPPSCYPPPTLGNMKAWFSSEDSEFGIVRNVVNQGQEDVVMEPADFKKAVELQGCDHNDPRYAINDDWNINNSEEDKTRYRNQLDKMIDQLKQRNYLNF